MRRLALGLAGALLLAGGALAQSLPALTGRVVDGADVLPPATEQALTAKLEGLEQRTGRQLAVVTVRSLQGQAIEDYGYRLGRAWGLGDSKRDDGALLLVAPNDREVRIEVGYGLEPILTDAMSGLILRGAVLPRFREGDIPGGVEAGTDAIIAQLSLEPDAAAAKAAQAAAPRSEASDDDVVGALVTAALFLFVIGAMLSRMGRRRRRRGGLAEAVLWGLASNALSSGGSRGGSSRGGGFGGGGGSFGGGGASGRW